MIDQIGNRVKKRRKELGLTQKALAKDICTQAQISNLEKGTLNPSSTLLFQLSTKLKVDMNYFFNISSTSYEQNPHFYEVKLLIEQLKSERNYKSIKYIVDNELKINRNNYTIYELRFLKWHKAIYLYYLNKESENSLKLLRDLLASIKDHESSVEIKLQNIEIMTSISIILQDEESFNESLSIYMESLELLRILKKSNPDLTLHNNEIKILFGLSQTLTYLKMYKESYSHTSTALSLSFKNQSLFMLADIHYQNGFNLVKLNREEEGLEFIKAAESLFKIQKNEHMVSLVNNELNNIINNLD